MGEIAAFDLWDHARLPPDKIAHSLKLGRSSSQDVIKYMQLKRRSLSFVRSETDQFGLPKGWMQVRGDMIELLFDEHDAWQSMSYGSRLADQLTWQVESAIIREAGTDAPQASAGAMPLQVHGRALGELATLSNFMRMNGFGDPGEPAPLWSIIGREYDKWIEVSTRLAHGIVSAEFLLKTNKAPFESRFEIDYCLHRLTISSADAA